MVAERAPSGGDEPGALAVATPTVAAAPPELHRRFGDVVRQLRRSRGWSQERLAGRAELNRSYMGEIERAAVMPSLATADKLAQALELPLSELIAWCERGRSAR
jgi:ribosome-binding protein aMBF1 (putative translation factor)